MGEYISKYRVDQILQNVIYIYNNNCINLKPYMYIYVYICRGYEKTVSLEQDDIEAIEALYGQKVNN